MREAPPVESAMSPLRLRLVTLLVTGALFMEILDGTVIATALPSMARAFGTSAVALNLGVSAYLLALGVFIPLSGWICGRYGARRIFACAIALFTVASALCGTANGLAAFVALRIVQGVAGAMMVPVGRLVVIRHTPRERLMLTMSTLVWPALVAPVFGPPLGGFIVMHASWRWIFYLNVPLGLVGLAGACWLLPGMRENAARPFDLRGFLLSGIGTFALLLGLDRAVQRPGAVALGLLVLGACALFAAVRHLKRASAPMLKLDAYAIPTFRAAMRGGALSRAAISSVPFLLPLLFQVGFGFSAFRSGLLVLAVFVGDISMKTVTTRILRRFGYRPVLIWNSLLCMASLFACACLDRGMPAMAVMAVLFVSGAARSMQFTSLSTLAFADVPKERMADANSLFNTINQLSAAAGITFGALAVRVGGPIADALGIHAGGAGFRAAFPLVALMVLPSLVDALRLPHGAGDHFVARRPEPG